LKFYIALEFLDETEAYTKYKSRGSFTPNPCKLFFLSVYSLLLILLLYCLIKNFIIDYEDHQIDSNDLDNDSMLNLKFNQEELQVITNDVKKESKQSKK
jgi:hypothetical protein